MRDNGETQPQSIRSVAVGIDFGTSNSSCCIVENGDLKLGRAIGEEVNIPSVVIWHDAEHQYGKRADESILNASEDSSVQSLRDLLPRVFWEFKRRLSDKPIRKINGRSIYSEDVISEFIGYLLRGTGLSDGKTCISSICITHPVNFKQEQKDILARALYRNGFCREIKLISEPVAAAMGYEAKFDRLKAKKGILVFDFGGGTLDVAYVMRNAEGMLVSPRTNCQGMPLLVGENIGGADLDMIIYPVAMKQFNLENGVVKDQSIKRKCQRLKEQLSKRDEAEFSVMRDGKSMTFKMTRREFENLLQQDVRVVPVLKRCLKSICGAVAADGALPQIDCLLPIGGSCRVPAIHEFLKSSLPPNAELLDLMPDDVAVAMGAAVEASRTSVPAQLRELTAAFQKWTSRISDAIK